jgi:hypothetical protein
MMDIVIPSNTKFITNKGKLQCDDDHHGKSSKEK